MDPVRRPRRAVDLQEVPGGARHQAADRRVGRRPEHLDPPEILRQEQIARLAHGPLGQKALAAAGAAGRRKERAQRVDGTAADVVGGEVRRAAREEAIEHVPRNQPPLQQVREPFARAVEAELREDQRQVGLTLGEADEDGERLVERSIDEPRHLRLVGHAEAGIEIGLERELAEQRQAEGVDGADLDVREPIANRRPARSIERVERCRLAQLADDPLAHLGGRLARERDREDVGRVDASGEQVHVARDEHAGLARPGRRLEHDVLRRIGGKRPRLRVGISGL